MSKRLIFVLALVLAIGLTASAYAEVQNVKVSGDISATGVMRDKLTLQNDQTVTNFGRKISGILSQARVRVDADLTDNVTTTVRLLNERMWGAEVDNSNLNGTAHTTDIDLDLAYVTLKEFLYSPLTLTIGRQELRYGNALIIGDVDTNGIAAGHGTTSRYLPNSLDDLSLRKSFDAVKGVLNYTVAGNPLAIDLVFSKIDQNITGANQSADLWGVNVNYVPLKDTVTELYFWDRSRKALATGTIVDNKWEVLQTLGARVAYAGIKDLNVGLEGAWQFGNHMYNATWYPDDNAANATVAAGRPNRKVQAFAIQATGNYVFSSVKFTPMAKAAYTYLSGDKYNGTSNHYRGWSSMYEDQAGGTLFNKIVGYSNAQQLLVGASMKAMDDLSIGLDYYYLILNQPYTYDTPGNVKPVVILSGVAGDPTYTMKPDKHGLGHEVDLKVTYDYTEDVQFIINTGAFIPGTAFDGKNKQTASQVIGSMKVTF
ncbi:MAG: alginate export family protein [Candidatus Omnitrophota bacterium]